MKKIILLIFLTIPTIAFSQSKSESEIIAILSKATAETKSIECEFTQTKTMKLLGDKMISNGKMYFQSPGKLHWEYISPYKYIFILNDNKVILKNSKHENQINVNQNKMFKEIARIMMNSVVGKCLNNKMDFKLSAKETSFDYIVSLSPQSNNLKQLYSQIIIHFDHHTLYVKKLELNEKKGNNTIIELKNIKKNETVNPSHFKID